ncbi:hypothetical protein XK97_14680 [Obesumbacterium proteus]|uniref:hypothetical protein n=1 Tax=Obesumbacterium proteus TaxID=82983 RepID=UPI000621416B|nr:hypothetical protein [Obesumbacterium proteus]KKI44219.1 hypothetical protein XK97_14680 [Obesumbacterium proteus]
MVKTSFSSLQHLLFSSTDRALRKPRLVIRADDAVEALGTCVIIAGRSSFNYVYTVKMKTRLWLAIKRWWQIRSLKRFQIEHLALRRKAFKDGRLGFLDVFHHERCYRDIRREVRIKKLNDIQN